MSAPSHNEYLYEWVCPMREDEPARMLLVGDFSMYEARLALEGKLPFALDAVGGNTPLACRLEHLESLLSQRRYSAVVVGETCRSGGDADTACLPGLMSAHPQMRFMAATAAAPFLVKKRYRTPADALDERNTAARRMAAELGLPCMDMAMAASRLGAGSFATYLLHSAASLVLPGRSFRNPAALRRKLHDEVSRFLQDEVQHDPASAVQAQSRLDSSIRWKNRFRVCDSECLCIGDSNMYRFRLANPFLRRHADVYASSFSPLWEDTQQDLQRMLRPEHRTVVFSLGAHHLEVVKQPGLPDRCRRLIATLQGEGRKVVAVGVSPLAMKDNVAALDEVPNAMIRQQNATLRMVAEEAGLDFVDTYAMLENAPHVDLAHFRRAAYFAPGRAIAACCKR